MMALFGLMFLCMRNVDPEALKEAQAQQVRVEEERESASDGSTAALS